MVAFTPGTMARESDSPVAVFITCPPGNYTVNSTVQVEVLVFNELEPYDPGGDIRFVVGEDYREIELNRTRTGVYSGTFKILGSDVRPGGVELKATVRHSLEGDQYVSDRRDLPIYQEGLFNMELFPRDQTDLFPKPGDEVEIEMRLYNASQPIEAVEGSVKIEAYGDDIGVLEFEVERVDTGRYIGRFQLDTRMKEGGVITVTGSADAIIDGYVVGDWDMFDLVVGSYWVWTHLYDVTRSSAHLDVFVRDVDGRPITGASVLLEFGYFHPIEWMKVKNLTGTTGDYGRATFNLEFDDIFREFPQGYIKIEIVDGTVRQRLEQPLSLGEVPDDVWDGDGVPDDGLWIEQPVEHQLKPGTRSEVTFKAWFDGRVLRNHEITYFLMDGLTLVEKGSLRTDDRGSFGIEVDAPEVEGPEDTYHYVHLYFQALVGGTWGGTMEGVMSGNSGILGLHDARDSDVMTIEVGDVERGEMVDVVISHPAADGTNETAFLNLDLGPVLDVLNDEAEYEIPDWAVLVPSFANMEGERLPLRWEDGAYVTEFLLPEYFPTDWKFHLVAVMDFHGPAVMHSEGTIVEVSVTGESTVGPGAGPGSPDEWYLSSLLFILFALVISVSTVAIMVLVLAKRSRGSHRPPGGP